MEFSQAVLKTINNVFKKFSLYSNKDNIYVFVYDNKNITKDYTDNNGLVITYPEIDVIVVDKSLVIPFTKEHLEKRGGWYTEYENEEYLLGFTVGCEIFSHYAKNGY